MEEALRHATADKIDLSGLFINSPEDVSLLVNWVQANKPGEVILSGCHLSDEYTHQIIECCALNENLRILDLSNNLLDEHGCQALHVLLNSNKCVETINILSNPILSTFSGVGMHPLLASLLRLFSESRYLRSVCGCSVTRPWLVLPSSLIYDHECDLVVAELKKNTDLKSLHAVCSKGFQQILSALDVNKSLLRMCFESFNISGQLSGALGLSNNSSLKTVQVKWSDHSTEKEAETLILWLQQSLNANQHVTTLQLDSIPLDGDLYECLFEMLRYNRSLLHLGVFNMSWTEGDKAAVLSALRKNKALRVLHIAYNNREVGTWSDLDHDLLNDIVEARGTPLILRINDHQYVFGQLHGRHASDEWEVGDSVEALLDESTWMEGEIIAVNTDFKYSILFSNGQIKSNFRGNKIRRGDNFKRVQGIVSVSAMHQPLAYDQHLSQPPSNHAQRYEIGQSVAVRFYGDNLYYPAVIQHIANGSLFTVQVEGIPQSREVEGHMVCRVIPTPAGTHYDAGFYLRGDYVDVYFAHDEHDYTGAWKRGRIAHDNRDGTYYVRLENGADLSAVRGKDLRFHFRAKDSVDVRLKELSEWYKGRIMKVEGLGSYYVKYDVLETLPGESTPQVITYQEHSVTAHRLIPSGREEVRSASIQYGQQIANYFSVVEDVKPHSKHHRQGEGAQAKSPANGNGNSKRERKSIASDERSDRKHRELEEQPRERRASDSKIGDEKISPRRHSRSRDPGINRERSSSRDKREEGDSRHDRHRRHRHRTSSKDQYDEDLTSDTKQRPPLRSEDLSEEFDRMDLVEQSAPTARRPSPVKSQPRGNESPLPSSGEARYHAGQMVSVRNPATGDLQNWIVDRVYDHNIYMDAYNEGGQEKKQVPLELVVGAIEKVGEVPPSRPSDNTRSMMGSQRHGGVPQRPNKYKVGAKIQCLHSSNQWLNGVVSENHKPGVYTILLLESPLGDDSVDGGDNSVYICTEDMLRPMRQSVENSFERSPRNHGEEFADLVRNTTTASQFENSSIVSGVRGRAATVTDSPRIPVTDTSSVASTTMVLKEGMRVSYYPEDNNSLVKYVGFIEQVHRGNNMVTIIVDDNQGNGQAVYTVPFHRIQPVRAGISRSPNMRPKTANPAGGGEWTAVDASRSIAPEPVRFSSTAPLSNISDMTTISHTPVPRAQTSAIMSPAVSLATPMRPSSERSHRPSTYSAGHRHLQDPIMASLDRGPILPKISDDGVAAAPKIILHHFSELLPTRSNPLFMEFETMGIASEPGWELDLSVHVDCASIVSGSRGLTTQPVEILCYADESALDLLHICHTQTVLSRSIRWPVRATRPLLRLYFNVSELPPASSTERIELHVRVFSQSILIASFPLSYDMSKSMSSMETFPRQLVRSEREVLTSLLVAEITNVSNGQRGGAITSKLSDQVIRLQRLLPHLELKFVSLAANDRPQSLQPPPAVSTGWDSLQIFISEELLQRYSWDELMKKYGIILPTMQDFSISVLFPRSANMVSVYSLRDHLRYNSQYSNRHLHTLPQGRAHIQVLLSDHGDAGKLLSIEMVTLQRALESYWTGYRESSHLLPAGLIMIPGHPPSMGRSHNMRAGQSQGLWAIRDALFAYIQRMTMGRTAMPGPANGHSSVSEAIDWRAAFLDIHGVRLGDFVDQDSRNPYKILSLLPNVAIRDPSLHFLTHCAPWAKLSIAHLVFAYVANAVKEGDHIEDLGELFILFEFFDLLDRMAEEYGGVLSPVWEANYAARLVTFCMSPDFHGKVNSREDLQRVEQVTESALRHPLVVGGRHALESLASYIRRELERYCPRWLQQMNAFAVSCRAEQHLGTEWMLAELWEDVYQLLPSEADGREVTIRLMPASPHINQSSALRFRPFSSLPNDVATVPMVNADSNKLQEEFTMRLMTEVGLKDVMQAQTVTAHLLGHGCSSWADFMEIFVLLLPTVTHEGIHERLKSFFAEEVGLPLISSLKLAAYLVRINS